MCHCFVLLRISQKNDKRNAGTVVPDRM